MKTDRQMTFSPNQAVTASALSTDVYDSGVEGIDINNGRQLTIFGTVTTAFAGGTSVQLQLIESSSSDMSSPDVLAESQVIAVADLVAGKELLRTTMPRTSKRYISARYVVVGTPTAGEIWAGIVCTADDTVVPNFETGL